ncbi:hypothetical protein G3M83_07150 [Rouxiella badensis]|uniref:hypothetical protein n=1 Tax=Rouxiella badensis TaxID=1646377 RepID=UPI0013EF41AE|nr:hypothetical protein [Rouxiella badensis]QII37487.1 hypothetical protein G3M83_07150 [Rouxiella badensis]
MKGENSVRFTLVNNTEDALCDLKASKAILDLWLESFNSKDISGAPELVYAVLSLIESGIESLNKSMATVR